MREKGQLSSTQSFRDPNNDPLPCSIRGSKVILVFSMSVNQKEAKHEEVVGEVFMLDFKWNKSHFREGGLGSWAHFLTRETGK